MIPQENDGGEPLPVRIDDIPAELRQCAQWVTWRLELRNGKATKVPYTIDGKRAKTTDRRTWSTFELAVQTYRNEGCDGIGFVFGADDGFSGIDLDQCRGPDTGVIEPWAMEIIQTIGSYAEVSPSGTGVKIFLRGKIPGTRRRQGNIEMYDSGRYFTVTGHHLDGTPTTIESCQEQIDELHRRVFGSALPDEDTALIQKAMNAKNGRKFKKLWEGNITGYPSDSEADLALCSVLGFWTGNDAERIDRLFRESRLYRPKWDRPDYRKRTIGTALNGRKEYSGQSRPQAGATAIAKPGYLTELWAAERMVERHGCDLCYR